MQPKFYSPAERALCGRDGILPVTSQSIAKIIIIIMLLYYFKVDKLHNAVLSPHEMNDTVPTLPPKTEGLPSTRCLYC